MRLGEKKTGEGWFVGWENGRTRESGDRIRTSSLGKNELGRGQTRCVPISFVGRGSTGVKRKIVKPNSQGTKKKKKQIRPRSGRQNKRGGVN